MTKVNTKCFMWDILSRIDRSSFDCFTFDDKHIADYTYNYHFGISTGDENVYISVMAFDPKSKNDDTICNICIKTNDGRLNDSVLRTIQGLDNAIKNYWNEYWYTEFSK